MSLNNYQNRKKLQNHQIQQAMQKAAILSDRAATCDTKT